MKHKTKRVVSSQQDRVHPSFPPMGSQQPAYMGSQSASPMGEALGPLGPQGPQGPIDTQGQG